MSEKSIIVRQVPNFRTPQTPTEEQAFALLRELKDLFEQYRREVPSKRRPWPESIKKRILALWSLGVGSHQIAAESGVPVMTLYSWRQRIKRNKKGPGFSEIPIVRAKRRTGFQIKQDNERRRSELQLSQLEPLPTTDSAPIGCVTITLPSGIKLEGIPLDQVPDMVRKIGEA